MIVVMYDYIVMCRLIFRKLLTILGNKAKRIIIYILGMAFKMIFIVLLYLDLFNFFNWLMPNINDLPVYS